MKKKYIIPRLTLTKIGYSAMISASVAVDSTQDIGSSTNFVKGQSSSSRSDVNVWNDDWSNN